MSTNTYDMRRAQLETYFDRTALEAWKRLTSDAPVSAIRATVRAGRDRMRRVLLDWLPSDLTGARVLDAGCGTGALAIEAARRGAHVVAVDVSSALIDLAHSRRPAGINTVEFRVGDMSDEKLGEFDYVVAMDSLIHYSPRDALQSLAAIARRTRRSIVFTFAPLTPALALMHSIGRLFPHGNRAPAIEPHNEHRLRQRLATDEAMAGWRIGRTERVHSGFYTSQALELVRR
jgi:magnesium-protoporphyrin O-methyltransferase